MRILPSFFLVLFFLQILIEACSHSVIMWDFDVVHGAVQFCVFRLADHRPGQVESDIEVVSNFLA